LRGDPWISLRKLSPDSTVGRVTPLFRRADATTADEATKTVGKCREAELVIRDLSTDKIHECTESGLNRREQLLELTVFLLLIVPSMLLSFFAIRQGGLSFVLTAWATVLRDLGLVALIFFFLRRNGEPRAFVGWNWNKGWKEIAWGIGLFVPFTLAADLLERGLLATGFSAPSTPLPAALTAKGISELFLAALLVLVVTVSEETIFRGYLILRIKGVTGSRVGAAILSAFIFSLGHGYEGSAGVVTVGFMGLVFAFVYLWRRSLVAPAVMHFLQDFIGIVLVPLLGLR
jgi:membrane protease YdiL (CAAX protease family)